MEERLEGESPFEFLPPPTTVYEPLKPTINSMEVFLLLLALYSGIYSVFIGQKPGLLSPNWLTVWAVSLIGGAVLALLGILWKGRAIISIAFQEIGYSAFGIASLAHATALTLVNRPSESITVFGFAIATIIRVLQLEKRLRRERDVPNWILRWRE